MMMITWGMIAVAALLLWLKISAIRERKGKGRYADECAADRQERMDSDAAFEQQELERKNAYETAENNASMRL